MPEKVSINGIFGGEFCGVVGGVGVVGGGCVVGAGQAGTEAVLTIFGTFVAVHLGIVSKG
jgi:hypothetical protein